MIKDKGLQDEAKSNLRKYSSSKRKGVIKK